MFGYLTSCFGFRRKLFVFLLMFCTFNVILLILYPQFYGGEFLGLNPVRNDGTTVSRLGNKNKTFSDKYENTRTNFANGLDGSAKTGAELENTVQQNRQRNLLLLRQFVRTDVPSSSKQSMYIRENTTFKDLNFSRHNSIEQDVKLQNSWTISDIFPRKTEYNATIETNSSKIVIRSHDTNATDFVKQYSHTTTESLQPMKESPQAILWNAFKLVGNRGKLSKQELRLIVKSKNILTDFIELLNRTNNTKLNTLVPTMATTLTTPTLQKATIEPTCKLYTVSEKSKQYTATKYKINPDIVVCRDQKVAPYELCTVNETKTRESFTKLQIKCDFSVCDKNKDMFIEVMEAATGLMKQNKIPKDANDDEIEELVDKFAEETRKNSLPFLFVNCSDKTGAVAAQLLTFLPPLPLLNDTTTRDKINVNLFLVDSVSRPHFYRSFPKTVSYLKEINESRSFPAHVFNFEFFQAVHGHTNENERALFNGSLFPVKLGGKKRDKTPVNLEPLYAMFKGAGYQTMFLDDLCWRGHWGIMHKYKIYSWASLQSTIKKSSIDTRGITESACAILKRNKMSTPFYAGKSHQICFNGRHQHEYVLEYMTKYFEEVATSPQSKPLFAYTSTHVSHDDVGIRVQTLDTHLTEYIYKLATLENTLSIIFADHGNTYTSYQAYADGKQEMYHPFMLMVVPKKLGKKLGGNVLRNLHENQKRLIHLFDLRAGLLELARYDGTSALRPTGIFGRFAANRTCDELLLTEQSKCICQGWEIAIANTTDQLAFAEFAVGELNNKIQASLLESRTNGVASKNSRVTFGACQRLRVQNIRNVKTRKTQDGTKATTIDVKVQSSNLVDQEELITVQVLSKDSQPNTDEMTFLSFNRISSYGIYRTCMDKGAEVKLCVCNNPKDLKPLTTLQDVVGKNSKVAKLQRCLYEIIRTYNDRKTGKPMVKVYEIANTCRYVEFSVAFLAKGRDIILSTETPIVVKLPPQTVQFVATARTKENARNARLRIKWRVEKRKK